MTKRLLVMAGGTGGHVFPGIAVAKKLQALDWKIHWLGTSERMEAKLVPKAGFDISFIDVVGVRKNGLARLLMAPFKIIKATFQAHKVIRQFKPDVVIGMGGFASGPGGVAAWLHGIPLVIHEQNAAAGLTNKLLAKIATQVMTGFDNTFANQANSKKFHWVGNPVRQEFCQLAEKKHISLPLNLLIVGGSLGAQKLNQILPEALAGLDDIAVHHQSGAGQVEQVQQAYAAKGLNQQVVTVSEFIEDMPQAYAWADLIICRAGALTVAEVAAAGVAAIFVPLPHAVDDHQTKNAMTLVNIAAARLLPQQTLTSQSLRNMLQELVNSPEQLITMGQQAKTLARVDAAQTVAHCCIELSEQAA